MKFSLVELDLLVDYLVEPIKDIENKPYLLGSLVSHVRRIYPRVGKGKIKKAIIKKFNWSVN